MGILALWWTGTRARELAVSHARRACTNASLQLLDQTVALKKIRSARDQTGGFCLRREYGFEFTQSGQHRDSGSVTMRGYRLVNVDLPFVRDNEGNRVFEDS